MTNKVVFTPLPTEDPLTMLTKRLGEAKTEATKRGARMVEMFEQIKKIVDELSEQHGLAITNVEFEDKAVQAAWHEFTTDSTTLSEMPLMEHEGTLTARVIEIEPRSLRA